jgi:hypothetical protein
LQVSNLKDAHLAHPTTAWWIKADGCDVVKGLFESHVEHRWAGDVDLNDGSLAKKHAAYIAIITLLDDILTGGTTMSNAQIILRNVNDELKFISSGMGNMYVSSKHALCTVKYQWHVYLNN